MAANLVDQLIDRVRALPNKQQEALRLLDKLVSEPGSEPHNARVDRRVSTTGPRIPGAGPWPAKQIGAKEGATIRADYLQEEGRRQNKSSAVSERQNRDLRCRWLVARGNFAGTILAKA